MLSAKNYIERGAACTAGREAGSAYALVILLVLAMMSWHEYLPTKSWATLWLGAAVIVGFRVGMEQLMGNNWDYYEAKRHHLMQSEHIDSHTAFERVRDSRQN